MTIRELHTAVVLELQRHQSTRIGQAYFNCLCDLDEHLAEMVRGGPIDPFHDDRRLPDFLTFLEEHLTATTA